MEPFSTIVFFHLLLLPSDHECRSCPISSETHLAEIRSRRNPQVIPNRNRLSRDTIRGEFGDTDGVPYGQGKNERIKSPTSWMSARDWLVEVVASPQKISTQSQSTSKNATLSGPSFPIGQYEGSKFSHRTVTLLGPSSSISSPQSTRTLARQFPVVGGFRMLVGSK